MMPTSRFLLIGLLASVATGRFLAKPSDSAAKATNTTQALKVKPGNATINVTAKHLPLSEEQQLESLNSGLVRIAKLQSVFTAKASSPNPDMTSMSDFASGAMTSELSKKDSVVWSTIESMMGATAQVMSQTKGKTEAEKKKLFDSLETILDSKAATLKNVTNKASEVQDVHSSEYIVGLLNQHPQWSMEKQLNATRTFAGQSKEARELLKHYNASMPLAPQLAALMDAKPTAAKKQNVTAKAAKMFLQLASSFHLRQ